MSDIHFFEQEMDFLESIIQSYFMVSGASDTAHEFILLEQKLDKIKNRQQLLKEDVLLQQNYLSSILDRKDPNSVYCKEVQLSLEAEFFDFIRDYRNLKRELFAANKKTNKLAVKS